MEGLNEKIILLTSLPAMINGGAFFSYVLYAMVFIAIWKLYGGRNLFDNVQLLGSREAAETVEQVVVGAGTSVALLVSIGTLIVAAVVAAAAGGSTCRSMEANVFVALNLLITFANVAACIQVSIVFIDALKNCLERNGGKVLAVCINTDWITSCSS